MTPAQDKASTISVLIVEDHQMVGEMVAMILRDESDLRIAGWAKSVAELNDCLGRESVDVVLMDYRLPDGDGVTAAAHVRSAYPNTRVVMVTAEDNHRILASALRAGCAGYVCKTTQGVEQLPVAIRAAHAGSTAVSPEMLARVMYTTSRPPAAPGHERLSDRELGVLRLLAEGLGVAEIAEQLFLSPHTVRNHTQSVLEKLDAHSRLEAVTIALRQGLITLPPQD